MVFLHALPHDLTCWTYQTAHFSSAFRTVAIDLPGHGRSPSPAPGITMADLARACWATIDTVLAARVAPGEPTDQIVLVGLSVGAITAKHMVGLRPERVRALVLSGGGYHEGRKGIAARHVPAYRADGARHKREHLAANFSEAFAATPLARYLVELALSRRDPDDVAGTIALLEALDAPDPEGLHERIRVPTLVVAGGEDRSLDRQRELARRIAGAEIHVIEGAGHACNLERPWEYDRAVLEFLGRKGAIAR
jgi:pimeloyl-ACP methyl ester carboxylesterase